MEHYHHKDLYLEIFKELLMEEEFKNHPHFGIVVQAYLRESLDDLKSLIDFCKKRRQKITIRLVKGAYWDSEFLLSKQKNWPIPVYTKKEETDLNFEKALALLFKESKYVKIAVGSHNVRSIACALAYHKNHPEAQLEFQFLYGMAEGLAQALKQKGCLTRLYCTMGDLIPGMSYLVRRLLENSANQSFILNSLMKKQSPEKLLSPPLSKINLNRELKGASERKKSNLREETSIIKKLKASFLNRTFLFKKLSLKREPQKQNLDFSNFNSSHTIEPSFRSSQDSLNKTEELSRGRGGFLNFPVPDFSKKQNRDIFEKALQNWESRFPVEVPLLIKPPKKPSILFSRENPNKKKQIISKTAFVDREQALKAVEECHQFFCKMESCFSSQANLLFEENRRVVKREFFPFRKSSSL